MATRYIMQRHTLAWRILTWTSFTLSVAACAVGLLYMPDQDVNRTFLVGGLIFCVAAAFAVSKTIRDNRDGPSDTPTWVTAVWVIFCTAMALMAWGLWSLGIDTWHRGFMVVGWLYLVGSACTLSKMLRDQSEADLVDRDSSATPSA